ncbi:hypothetical protein JCM11251_007007 [Rhodosporidiobolus azoricus]
MPLPAPPVPGPSSSSNNRYSRSRPRKNNAGDLIVADISSDESDGGRGRGGTNDSYSPSQEDPEEDVDELESDDDTRRGRASKPKAAMKVKAASSAPKNKTTSEQQKRRQELAARLAGGNGKEGGGHSGRKTTMSCENCRLRKMKCSRHPVCNNCRMRGDECVYLDLGPQNAARFASHHASVTTNREEIARLNRLIRMLSARYAVREAALAKEQKRDPRPLPSLADVHDREQSGDGGTQVKRPKKSEAPSGKKADGGGPSGRHNSSPLEDAEALLALATPTVRDPPVAVVTEEAEAEVGIPVEVEKEQDKEKEHGSEEDSPTRIVDDQQQPTSTTEATGESGPPASEKTPPPSNETSTSVVAVAQQPTLPSPDVVRPFGRPKLPRSVTTTDAVPSLRVSIPQNHSTNGRLPFPPSSRSSGHSSSGRQSVHFPPPLNARAWHPPPPYYARSQTHNGQRSGGPFAPLDLTFEGDLIPTAEYAYPHLSPFLPLPHAPQGLPLHLRGRPPPHSLYGTLASPQAHSPFSPSLSGGRPLPLPPHFPSYLPSPSRPPRPEPYYYYPTLPSPLLSPRSVADLAATKQRMQFLQNQPHVQMQRQKLHEERYERAVAVERAKQEAAAKAKQQQEEHGENSSFRMDKGKRRADDLTDDDEREEEAKKAAAERQRDLARRAAESWAAFAAHDAASNEAFATVEPYRPMAREADPMLGITNGGANGLPSANPLSAGAFSYCDMHSLGNRRASWLLLSPAGSHSALSPRLAVRASSSRPSLTLDPITPAFSALRTPSAGPLSSLPSAGALLSGFGGLPSAGAGGAKPYISLSPMRSAHPLHSAIEDGLRPFSSIRGVIASPSSQRGTEEAGELDERFEPMLERFEPMMERHASQASGYGGADGRSRFEPVLEEQKREEKASPSTTVTGGGGVTAASPYAVPAVNADDAPREGDEAGWETDGKSSVGRRSARSVSRMSARSRGEEEAETEDETEEE